MDRDGKGNLEVNYLKGVYNCWACAETNGTKGRLYSLFKKFAPENLMRDFLSLRLSFDDKYQFIFEPQKPKVILPQEFIALATTKRYELLKPAYNYLYKRGINDEIINKHNIGYCFTGKYANRVVFPSYDVEGELNYYVTRLINDKKEFSKIKYLNSEGDKTAIIFNEKLINWDKTVFLVEGVFDHVILPNSIPLLGKKMYDKIFSELYFKSTKQIVIILDPDANSDAINIFNKLNSGKLRNRVYLNFLPNNYDLSKFNEVYGFEGLKKWVKNKNFIIND